MGISVVVIKFPDKKQLREEFTLAHSSQSQTVKERSGGRNSSQPVPSHPQPRAEQSACMLLACSLALSPVFLLLHSSEAPA